jgi:4-hydroxythreonine-4-phosphate dehydrogenase
MNSNSITIGISQGDFNGIGLEVILKTFLDPGMLEVCTPVLFSSGKTFSFHRKALHADNFNYNVVSGPEKVLHRKFNLYNCYPEEAYIELGKLTQAGGKYAIKSLITACDALEKNQIDALVTAPINKHNTHSESFPFTGHTPYLAKRFGKGNALMLLVSQDIKIALLTEHLPLSEVSKAITAELVALKLKLLISSLKDDFGISKPKIAVLGLNPHAGDGGTIGNEDTTIIEPVVKNMQKENALIFGPYPADGFFGSASFKKFDAVLAMYHDQGLIPFKYMAFETGVNFTAGLPVIRTSPDHGTAFDIAGKNKAIESSFRHAVYLACDIVKNRRENKILAANQLKPSGIPASQIDE